MKKIILSSIVVLGLSTAAFAQAGTDITALDTDGNGELSLAEVQATMPDVTAEQFAAADLDANGELSATEYATLTEAPAQ
ncbi:hypothetical protein PSQ90_08805 [Devosia rhodophyticola]|uniref:EF-hand domain-containing protein n=1 Tax=Devosia rhodophyticola TaxID=3026423 RepID=A0ABY7YSV0_9HYPH|nr:hypothetical protein [Devosia rhodophyticola]WDR04446.1 hypothetical protein PSQ90_08805 [Devosia rhodophyticola]